jgi:hypothetical protein
MSASEKGICSKNIKRAFGQNRSTTMQSSVLDRVEKQLASTQASIDRMAATVPTDLIELAQDLHPHTAGTYQSQDIAAPFLYRNQAILASGDALKKDMEFCQKILQSLLIDHPQVTALSSSASNITPTSIQQAPILNPRATSSADTEQLDGLTKNLCDLQARVQSANMRLDRLLQSYQVLVAAASEALVNAHEQQQQARQKK